MASFAVPEVGARIDCARSMGTSVARLRYVSGARQEALERMGIHTLRDLLFHTPNRYLDFSHVTKIATAEIGDSVTVVGVIDKIQTKTPKPKMSLVEVWIHDETQVMRITYFRAPWMANNLHIGDSVAFSGKVSFNYGFKQLTNPIADVLHSKGDSARVAKILPIHSISEGISVAWMRRIMAETLATYSNTLDYMPSELKAKRGLMGLASALRNIHFPASMVQKEQARRRLAYDELLCLQLALRTRSRIALGTSACVHTIDGPGRHAMEEALPFELSSEQKSAVQDILGDMQKELPMNRLLLGDVGTGKTAVCAVVAAAATDGGYQVAIMAPTSVLAAQYKEKIGPLFDACGIHSALLVGALSARERTRITEDLAAGTIQVVFGTTALLSDDVVFKNLGLVVVDEQHRFGVDQRAALRKKGAGADMLSMTATPIPRTLALATYGDVELSYIRKRPKAGAGISTKVITPENVDLAWGAIRDAKDAGQQAYVICPLIDEQDEGDELEELVEDDAETKPKLHAATKVAEDLSRYILKGMSIGLLTGKMSADEKDAVMSDFRMGVFDVLVSTTVVEVGVDVPNATQMVIYDADRFGLASLHQLRGRVGRGDISGQVFLISSAKRGSVAKKRLTALEKSSSGFDLAELDLKLRHEGEVMGYRQSGGVTLRLTDMVADADLIAAAHADAKELAEADPDLSRAEHVPLSHELMSRYSIYFDEMEKH